MRPRVDLQRFSRCAGRGDLVNYVLLEEGIASGRAAERVFRRPAAAEDDMKTAILSTENAQGRAHAPLGYVHTPLLPPLPRMHDVARPPRPCRKGDGALATAGFATTSYSLLKGTHA